MEGPVNWARSEGMFSCFMADDCAECPGIPREKLLRELDV